ncbi:DoxX family protein [uncultured Mycolicibacterium sp.]|uniref:DoxX family protein n=1 Tax=uncultured Mycolicibacterium sp. TaxID=2320817 RepID=UPI002615F3E2|nr:DoxX family protein [uncultured Mycolicibacterium sp.]
MTTTPDDRLDAFAPAVLSIVRIVFGLLFLVHGTAKLFGWPGGEAIPAGTWPFWWAGLIELVTGLLITVGLFTRAAAFVAAGQMAVAYFWMHLPNGFWPIANKGEPAVLFCFFFLALVVLGAGAWSVDAVLARRRR